MNNETDYKKLQTVNRLIGWKYTVIFYIRLFSFNDHFCFILLRIDFINLKEIWILDFYTLVHKYGTFSLFLCCDCNTNGFYFCLTSVAHKSRTINLWANKERQAEKWSHIDLNSCSSDSIIYVTIVFALLWHS